MARRLRVEYPGAIYHVMNRGDRREAIFRDDEDRRRFVATLGEACAKADWQVHAYCLMPNHFHMVLETPSGNLVAGMKWLLGTYTGRVNRRHRLSGHLFSGRYKALVVEGSGDGYLRTVCDYVHLNPVRAKLVLPGQPLREFRWSSFASYLQAPRRRPPWLRVHRLLGEQGIGRDSVAGRRELEHRVEERRRQDTRPEEWKPLRRGWYWGSEAFRQGLLERMESAWAEHHSGAERQESAVQKAERLVQEALGEAGWTEDELGRQPKGHAVKLAAAARLPSPIARMTVAPPRTMSPPANTPGRLVIPVSSTLM